MKTLVAYLKAYGEILRAVKQAEKLGLPWKKFSDPKFGAKAFQLMMQEIQREDFMSVMNTFYTLGKLTGPDMQNRIFELPSDERAKLITELEEATKTLSRITQKKSKKK